MSTGLLRILLTGASGFLGSLLALRFGRLGHEVTLLLRHSSGLGRLGRASENFHIRRCSGTADVERSTREADPDVVIHTACTYGRKGESLRQIVDTNVGLGLSVLEALQKREREVLFLNTGTALAPEVNPYALSKHQFAQWGRAAEQATSGRLNFVDVRLQHMYGPGDERTKFTSRVLQACMANEPRLELTAGAQRRDFIYIDDVVDGFVTLAGRAQDLASVAGIDLGSGEAPTVRHFVETIHRLTRSRTVLDFGALALRSSEPAICRADTSAMRALGWKPRHNVETGLDRTIRAERSRVANNAE